MESHSSATVHGGAFPHLQHTRGARPVVRSALRRAISGLGPSAVLVACEAGAGPIRQPTSNGKGDFTSPLPEVDRIAPRYPCESLPVLAPRA